MFLPWHHSNRAPSQHTELIILPFPLVLFCSEPPALPELQSCPLRVPSTAPVSQSCLEPAGHTGRQCRLHSIPFGKARGRQSARQPGWGRQPPETQQPSWHKLAPGSPRYSANVLAPVIVTQNKLSTSKPTALPTNDTDTFHPSWGLFLSEKATEHSRSVTSKGEAPSKL